MEPERPAEEPGAAAVNGDRPAPAPVPAPRRRRAFRTLLSAAGGLAIGEILFRFWLALSHPGTVDGIPQSPLKAERDTLLDSDLFRPLPDSLRGYGLRPGQRGWSAWTPMSFNSRGIRDREMPDEPPPGETRIAVAGPSDTFGWRVIAEETATETLASALNRLAPPGRTFEAVNLGVPGYCARQSVEFLLEEGLKLRPSLILLECHPLDATVHPQLNDNRPFRLDRFYLGRIGDALLERFLHGRAVMRRSDFSVISQPAEGGLFRANRRDIEARFRPLTGWEAVEESRRLALEIRRNRGIPLLTLIPAHYVFESVPEAGLDPAYDDHRRLDASLGIPVVETFPEIRRFVLEHGLSSRDLTVDLERDWHPNAARHALIASAMLEPAARSLGLEIKPEALEGERRNLEREARARLTRFFFYDAEDWGGRAVRWSRKPSAKTIVEPKGPMAEVRIYAGHPDASPEKPLRVRVTLQGFEPRERRLESPGGFEEVFDLAAPGKVRRESYSLAVEVDRLFKEGDPGRDLGVAVYDVE